jgi:hypothetical protein
MLVGNGKPLSHLTKNRKTKYIYIYQSNMKDGASVLVLMLLIGSYTIVAQCKYAYNGGKI